MKHIGLLALKSRLASQTLPASRFIARPLSVFSRARACSGHVRVVGASLVARGGAAVPNTAWQFSELLRCAWRSTFPFCASRLDWSEEEALGLPRSS